MSGDGMEMEHESERSTRPFGTRPFGTRPFGTRPFGTRPFGTRPAEAKPFGTRPFGTRPFGTRPFGTRPFGTRTSDAGDDCGDSGQQDWSTAIAELVCERSAVIRMGALLVTGAELRVPEFNPSTGFRAPGANGPAPGATLDPRSQLRPGDWTLEAAVSVEERLVDGIAERTEIAESFLVDLAEPLAHAVDGACLGTFAGGPQGIGNVVPRTGPAAGGGALLVRLRDLLKKARAARPVRNPGWILHPDALDAIARFVTKDGLTADPAGRTVDSSHLVTLDGADGGTLLGFPFLTSTAAAQGNRAHVYFSVDWQEAWLGVEPYLVDLFAPGEPPGAPDTVVLRASLPLDFALRRNDAFAWTVA